MYLVLQLLALALIWIHIVLTKSFLRYTTTDCNPRQKVWFTSNCEAHCEETKFWSVLLFTEQCSLFSVVDKLLRNLHPASQSVPRQNWLWSQHGWGHSEWIEGFATWYCWSFHWKIPGGLWQQFQGDRCEDCRWILWKQVRLNVLLQNDACSSPKAWNGP